MKEIKGYVCVARYVRTWIHELFGPANDPEFFSQAYENIQTSGLRVFRSAELSRQASEQLVKRDCFSEVQSAYLEMRIAEKPEEWAAISDFNKEIKSLCPKSKILDHPEKQSFSICVVAVVGEETRLYGPWMRKKTPPCFYSAQLRDNGLATFTTLDAAVEQFHQIGRQVQPNDIYLAHFGLDYFKRA